MSLIRLLESEYALGPVDLEAGEKESEDQGHLGPVPEALEPGEQLYASHVGDPSGAPVKMRAVVPGHGAEHGRAAA